MQFLEQIEACSQLQSFETYENMGKGSQQFFQNQGKYTQGLYIGGGASRRLRIFFPFFCKYLMSRHRFDGEKLKGGKVCQLSSQLALKDEKHKSRNKLSKSMDGYLESVLMSFIIMS